MLTLRGICKKFGGVRALVNVNLEIPAGHRFVLIGGSGAGKTTFLRVLAGLEPPDSGAVFCNEVDITHAPPHKRGIAMLSQDYAIYPHLTIEKNLLAAIEPLKLTAAERAERLESALGWFELLALRGRRPAQLSGGQMQRAALAKAMIRRPKVLLLDEPLSQLDLLLKEEGRGLILSLTEQFATTLVMVTHDPVDALRIADSLAVIEEGAIVQVDSPQRVYREPASRMVADLLSPFGVNEVELDRRVRGESAVDVTRRQANSLGCSGMGRVYFRPEAGELVEPVERKESADEILLAGRVERLQFLGFATLAIVSVLGQNNLHRYKSHPEKPQEIKVLVRDGKATFAVGQSVQVRVAVSDLLRLGSEQKSD